MPPPPQIYGIPADFVLVLAAMLISGVILLIAASYGRLKNKGPTTKPFVVLLVLCAAWSFLNALVLILQDEGQKIFFQQIEYLSIIFIPVALLVTVMTYLGRTSILNPRRYSLLLVLPAISVVMLLTNDYHHLFFTTHDFYVDNGLATMISTTGPYYLVHIIYLYALVLVTVYLLFRHLLSVEGDYRKRDLLILVGIALPFIGDAVSIMGASPRPEASWAPMLFAIMGLILLYALFRYRTFDLMPLARGLVWENTPDPLFVVDGQDQIVDVNEAGSKLLDSSPDQLLGKRMDDMMALLHHSSERPPPIGTDMNEVTVSRDGSKREYEVLKTPIRDKAERPGGTLVLFRDITMRKALHEETLQSERMYRLLIENTPFPIAVVGTRSGSVHLINGSMEKLLKGSRGEILEKDIGSFFLSRDDLDRLFSAMAKDQWVENLEAAMLNARGERFWAYLSAMPMPMALGEGHVTILAINDISDRKMAEALQTAHKKLNLLYGITRHDLLNKFTAISGYLGLLERTEDPEKRHQIIAKLELSAQAAQELICFTHDYENLGVSAPVWQSVGEAIQRARGRLDLSGIRVDVDVGVLQVYADSMLDKVFYNLMDNSLRHGERVTRIRISFDGQPGEDPSIVYEDDGAGITYEDKKSLFQQGKGKNTGQGMFLTKEILLITGMVISEDGMPGKGVRFRIKVPSATIDRSPRVPSPAAEGCSEQ
jgi:PAS domain S-box-containing protein